MTTPNNTRGFIGEDSTQEDDSIPNQARFQDLTALVSMYGTPDIFITFTLNTSQLDAARPGADTEY